MDIIKHKSTKTFAYLSDDDIKNIRENNTDEKPDNINIKKIKYVFRVEKHSYNLMRERLRNKLKNKKNK